MIEVEGLTKVYQGGVEAVKGIEFTVAGGEVFGLLGPNGAGKSTTIGMLTTTIAPTSGSARLAGRDVVREPLAARAVSSVVFQEPVVDKALTGRRNLELHARLWGARTERVDEAAAVLGEEASPLNLPSPADPALRALKALLGDPAVRKGGHDVKRASLALRRAGVDLAGIAYDTMLASFVLDPGKRSHDLDVLVYPRNGVAEEVADPDHAADP